MPTWKRTYWVVWVSNLVTAVGMMSFLPFFPSHLLHLGVEDEGARALWSGLIFGGAPLAAALMTPIWGALGDRYGRRLMTVRAMFAITIFVGAMSLATSPEQLFALRLAQGCFSGFVAPSITLVSVVAPADRQGQVAGNLQTAMALGAVIGPLLGGLMGPTLGLERVFVAVAISSAASGLLVWFLAEENEADRQAQGSSRGPLAALAGSVRDLRDVVRHPKMRRALAVLFFMILGMGATNPLLELFVEDLGFGHGEAERATGLLVSAFAAVNIVAMPLWGRRGDQRGHLRALQSCAWLAAVALAAHGFVQGVWSLALARLVLAVAMAGASPLAYGLAAATIPVQRRGGAMGAVFSARTLAISLSSMGGGALAALVGVRGLFFLGAGVIFVALLALSLKGEAQAASEGESAA
jgi:DHA1 family multidrug resistance protein-like MFS transporter